MKNLIYIFSLLMFTGLYAQDNNPVDVTEETKVKTIKVAEQGKVVEKKVKVKTLQTQEVKIDPEDRYDLNGNRIETPVKVTKTVMVDNDKDPYYETKTKVTYYKFNDVDYTFIPDEKGFIVTIKKGDSDITFGKARYSVKNMSYIFTTDKFTGVGYFDKHKTFVIEYYDGESDGLVTKEFKITK
ncbi:hypothetical protein ACFS5M_07750 [Lacinutrix iliipiscaria]|uniref:Uncharacterized protein n=1 Tax=Lacinutrix iliipiscaria TaxID=1230532 RepID=A0ABW5WLG1_9FLAO